MEHGRRLPVQKPHTCIGCEYYGDGQGYVQIEQTTQAPVLHILDAHPFKLDADLGKLGYSHTYQYLRDTLIPLAGVEHGLCTYSTVIQCRGPQHKDQINESLSSRAVQHCQNSRGTYSQSPRLIVGLGKAVFKYVAPGLRDPKGKPASFEDWRGYCLPLEYTRSVYGETPVYITHHPAEFHTNPGAERLTEWDWIKIRNVLDGSYP